MTNPRLCPSCNAPLAEGSRFCPRCGAVIDPAHAEEIALPGSKRLSVSPESLSIRELMAVVEAGVAWWRRRLEDADAVGREQAAAAIKDLSRILDSLAEQLARGRETMRITSRLPATRSYDRVCAVCGRGNRKSARFCISCGSPIGGGARPAAQAPAPAPLGLRIAARTDPGAVRPNNEDTYYTGEISTSDGPLATLLLVADGMGGAQAGEEASRLATETVKHELIKALAAQDHTTDESWEQTLKAAAVAANERVYRQAEADRAQAGMGTTLSVAVVAGTRIHIAHVGDTRVYLINPAGVDESGATCKQLTSDHTLVARLVDIGQLTREEARVHTHRNILYRSLGTDPTVDVDSLSHPLARGDILLLCSDGLDSYVPDEELARIAIDEEPGRACEILVDLAKGRGGHDNITVLVARVI